MNSIERAGVISKKANELSVRLQPILDPPIHLQGARGFMEWKLEEKVIEVSVFARLRFYARNEGDWLRPNPKMRYDMEISEDAFLDLDNDLLYDMIVFQVDQAFSPINLGPEYVLLEGIKQGYGTAVDFVKLT